MKAFHNDPALKEQILTQLQAHYDADEIIKGVYWENGKGCAVGCTIHSRHHKNYETKLGIPEVLAYLEDNIFEWLPNDGAKEWPMRFIRVISVGVDLHKVWPQFAVFLLTDPEHGVLQYAKTDNHKQIIQKVADLYSAERKIYKKEWRTARAEARRAYKDAESYYAFYTYLSAYCAASVAVDFFPKGSALTVEYASSAASAYDRHAFPYADYYSALADKLINLLSACK